MSGEEPGSRRLAELLKRYRAAAGTSREEIAQTITRTFSAERTILVGDMAGFTRRVVADGIVHFLALIHEMREMCCAIIEAHQGTCLKVDADNIFAAFSAPQQGLGAALTIQRALLGLNADRPEKDRVEICIGLAHGPVLVVGREDAWGYAVNVASKLGEDLAGPNEILADQSLLPWLEPEGHRIEARSISLSGVRLTYYGVRWA
jgi:class 3 adenylate cyclase